MVQRDFVRGKSFLKEWQSNKIEIEGGLTWFDTICIEFLLPVWFQKASFFEAMYRRWNPEVTKSLFSSII